MTFYLSGGGGGAIPINELKEIFVTKDEPEQTITTTKTWEAPQLFNNGSLAEPAIEFHEADQTTGFYFTDDPTDAVVLLVSGDSGFFWERVGTVFWAGETSPNGPTASLGKEAARWLKLWVQDIDASGELDVEGEATFEDNITAEDAIEFPGTGAPMCRLKGTDTGGLLVELWDEALPGWITIARFGEGGPHLFLPNATSSANGLAFGTTDQPKLYRSAANEMALTGSLVVSGKINDNKLDVEDHNDDYTATAADSGKVFRFHSNKKLTLPNAERGLLFGVIRDTDAGNVEIEASDPTNGGDGADLKVTNHDGALKVEYANGPLWLESDYAQATITSDGTAWFIQVAGDVGMPPT